MGMEAHEQGSDYLFHILYTDYIFCGDRSLQMIAWYCRWEHGDGSMWMGAWGWEQFFSEDLFLKTFLHHMIEMISLLTLAWKCGGGY